MLRVAVVLLSVLAALASASGPKPPVEDGWRPPVTGVDYGAYPSHYEDTVKAWIAGNLKDPDSVRYRRISRPRQEHAIVNQFRREAVYGYSVCVEYNARNSFGGYGGFETQWFLLRDGQIVRTHSASETIYLGHGANCADGQDDAPR